MSQAQGSMLPTDSRFGSHASPPFIVEEMEALRKQVFHSESHGRINSCLTAGKSAEASGLALFIRTSVIRELFGTVRNGGHLPLICG